MRRDEALLERSFASPPPEEKRGPSVLQRLLALDDTLARRGFPLVSTWWRETLACFYATKCRQLVLRVGRRGGKSSTLCRLGVCEALYGGHHVQPGDLGVVAIVSVSRDEASQRLRTVKAILDAMEVRYRPIEGGIELADRPIAFKVFAASISGVSGFTCICAICDEVAKWRDADTGANPAREVLASLRPTLATQPRARIFLSSSPLGRLDAHAAAYDAGANDFQFVALAPTWIANPTLSEADTRALEPDEDRWKREYGAIPMEGEESSLLSAALLDACTRAADGDIAPERGVSYVAAQDPGYTRNPWTFVIAAKRWVNGAVRKSIVVAREWRGTASQPINPAFVLEQEAILCRQYGIQEIWTDQYERFALYELAKRPEIDIVVTFDPELNAGNRLARYEALVMLLSNKEADFPAHKQLRADLLSVKQKLTPNGFVIHLPETPDGRHADFAPSVTLAFANCFIDPEQEAPPLPIGSVSYYAAQERALLQRMEERQLERLREESM